MYFASLKLDERKTIFCDKSNQISRDREEIHNLERLEGNLEVENVLEVCESGFLKRKKTSAPKR